MICICVFLLVSTLLFVRIPLKIDFVLQLNKRSNECAMSISLFLFRLIEIDYLDEGDAEDQISFSDLLFYGKIFNAIDVRTIKCELRYGRQNDAFFTALTIALIENIAKSLLFSLRKLQKSDFYLNFIAEYGKNVLSTELSAIITVSIYDLMISIFEGIRAVNNG